MVTTDCFIPYRTNFTMSLETAKSANYGHMVSLGSKNNIPNFLSLAVKPAVVSSVHVSEIDGQLKLDWSPPSGQVPEHCLEYEVEQHYDGKWQRKRYFHCSVFLCNWIFKIINK